MFRNNKEAKKETQREIKTPKKSKAVTELVNWQEERLKQVDKKFAAAASITDSAEKILRLQELISDVDSAEWTADHMRRRITARRHDIRQATGMSTGALVGAAALIVPGVILCPPVAAFGGVAAVIGMATGAITAEKISDRKSGQLMKKNSELGDFMTAMQKQETRALLLRDETINDCTFEEASQSPYLKEALHACSPFREHFAKAATDAAKKAQEEKAAVLQDAEAAGKTPATAPVRLTRLRINKGPGE